VRSKITRIAILIAAATPAAAFASDPAKPADPARERVSQSDPRGQRQAPPELICRSVEVAGSDSAPMVCMTASDWRRAEQ
jgi:hypothetical protein